MPDSFVVDACRSVVGVAVRAPAGYRFYSSGQPVSGSKAAFSRARNHSTNQSRGSRARATPAGRVDVARIADEALKLKLMPIERDGLWVAHFVSSARRIAKTGSP